MAIRMAELADAEAVLEIYAPYILGTTITFEYEVPTVESFRERMAKVLRQYPWLIWEEEGKILAYAYASDFGSRQAFSWSCELSVYVAEAARGKGIGKRLYQALLELVKAQGYDKAYALISVPNAASEGLHRSLGFSEEGRLRGIGYKFDQWLDLSYQVKRLRPEGKAKSFPCSWREVPAEVREQIAR